MKILVRNLIGLTAAIALSTPLTSFAKTDPTTPTPTPSASPTSALNSQLNNLDAQLDSVFTNTFQGLGDRFNQSKMSASIDLRDQKDKYVARIYLPKAEDTSKVNATVENGALHVTAGETENKGGVASANRFEQILGLPGPVQADKMQVNRKKNLIVITLPKATGSATTAQATASSSPSGTESAATDWDQSVVNQIDRMQGRMDQMMQEAFPRDFFGGNSAMNLGSAVNLDDQKDKYVVRFYLPDQKLSDVNVKYENGQLDLKAKEERKNQQANSTFASASQYEQMITLPGPVKDEGMKVDRKDATIVVTLPKA